MNKFALPVCIPQIYGFLHHAHKLSIILDDEKHLPWFYSNYIQLYTEEYSDEFKLDFYSFDGKYARHPGINENWYEKEFFIDMHPEIVTFIIGCITNGRYVEILMDEFYLSCKPAYQVWHSPHQSLIYGYDKDKECFLILGFNRVGDFGEIEASFREIEKAFLNSSIGGVGFFDCTTSLDYSNTNPEINLPVIKTYLKDFVHSTNSFMTYTPRGASYGLGTYKELYNRLTLIESSREDIRPIHIILEHKICMVNRLHYLEKKGYIAEASILINGFVGLVKDIKKMKQVQLKYCLTKDQRLISRVMQGLNDLMTLEEELLNQLLKKLD